MKLQTTLIIILSVLIASCGIKEGGSRDNLNNISRKEEPEILNPKLPSSFDNKVCDHVEDNLAQMLCKKEYKPFNDYITNDRSRVNWRDKKKRTLLHLLVKYIKPDDTIDVLGNGKKLFIKLAKMGNQVNVQDIDGRSVLHYTAQLGHVSLIEQALLWGGDTNLLDNNKARAIDLLPLENLVNESANNKNLNKFNVTYINYINNLPRAKKLLEQANFKLSDSFKKVVNPGAGDCFFYSVAPFIASIEEQDDPSHYDQTDIRKDLAHYLEMPGATYDGDSIQDVIDLILRPGSEHYQDVFNPHDLIQKLTNTGKFVGRKFWGDDFAFGLASQYKDLAIIKIKNRSLGDKGENIFYCDGQSLSRANLAFMWYYEDVHYEALKYVKQNGEELYTFRFQDKKNWPQEVKEVLATYKSFCADD